MSSRQVEIKVIATCLLLLSLSGLFVLNKVLDLEEQIRSIREPIISSLESDLKSNKAQLHILLSEANVVQPRPLIITGE